MSQPERTQPFPAFHVGDRIRKARESVGLDGKHFAAEIGISRQSLQKYESGQTTPRRPVFAAIAMRTGFTVDQLLGQDGPTGPDAPSGLGESPTKWLSATAKVLPLRPVIVPAPITHERHVA